MSYNNVVGGKLKLKGKALDVKAGSLKKKKKKSKESFEEVLLQLKEKGEAEQGSDAEGNKGSSVNGDEGEHGEGGSERQLASYEDHRTPAEKKYDEQRILLETRRLAKVASKSHRQKIEEFNQYLANLSEHYDIPKSSLTELEILFGNNQLEANVIDHTDLVYLVVMSKNANAATFKEQPRKTPIRVAAIQAHLALVAIAEGIHEDVESRKKLTEAASELKSIFRIDEAESIEAQTDECTITEEGNGEGYAAPTNTVEEQRIHPASEPPPEQP
ncbi:hypothetical protein R1sor_006200 [Riccia sorocarpa]|uniref:Uncharacterized protein n=1 Tax=Riccia sorocarpa TaxID=122646 RepID=A0ABD3HQD5_9MARC